MSDSPELPHLDEEQIRTWTLAEKDRWWFENVWRGDMPQLTLRSGLTGMLLGGILSLTNLYVGVKTGWTLGVGITSVVLAYALFKVLASLKLSSEFTLLENNCMQSIATAAGYMTGPLVTSLAAYMMVTDRVVPMAVTIGWMVALSILGVLFAFPLKKRFINEEQLPFPEGRAAGVVMHALHTGSGADGVFKAKILTVGAALSGLVALFKSSAILDRVNLAMLTVPEYLDGWLYRGGGGPRLLGTTLKDLTVRPDTDVVMMAAGGLMGVRTGVSILVGALVNYLVLAPWMIQRGDIVGHAGADGVLAYTFKDITMWALWGGVAMMTTSSLLSFFSKPQVLLAALSGLRRAGGAKQADPLAPIELPLWVSFAGVPVVGAVVVALAHVYFDVPVLMAVIAIPMVFVFSLIAVTSTGLTSITPTGAMGKLTQLTYGVLSPGDIGTNLMTAGITGEVASNTANLLMDIKPGYMLGAKPRHQAVGHVLGIVAGALVAVPVFYLAFLRGDPSGLVTEAQPFPGATVWKAVAEVLTTGLDNLRPSAQAAALAGAVLGLVLEAIRIATKGRFWLSAVGIGLAFVIPFNTCFAMFLGSALFWAAEKLVKAKGSLAHRVLVQNQETTCAGVIAGGALMGIAVIVVEVLVLGG